MLCSTRHHRPILVVFRSATTSLLRRGSRMVRRRHYTSCRNLSSSQRRRLPPPQDDDERPRRVLFSVPGSDERKLLKAQTLGADSIVLDLEDGVALSNKDQAREMVQNTLQNDDFGATRSEVCVRINSLDTDLAQRDLDAILPCPSLQTIVIPKVETPDHVRAVCDQIDAAGRGDDDDNVRILAAIESAVGMLNLRDIAAVSSVMPNDGSTPSQNNNTTTSSTATTRNKLDGLIFASEDYCSDLEAIRTPLATELLFARSLLVTTAKAYGLQAIDMVHINFRDLQDLERECRSGRELGFTGKQAIHPMQIQTIHKAFSPSPKDVDFSIRAAKEYKAATDSGKGACEVDGIVVDMPVYKWAIKILRRAEASGMLDKE